MMNYFEFDGKSSKDFKCLLSGEGMYDTPEPDVETIPVPGRNGVFLLDNKRYKNIKVKYNCYFFEDMKENFEKLKEVLLFDKNYHKLKDSYHPDEFRIAAFIEGIETDVCFDEIAEFNLTFFARPERFLESGDKFLNCKNGTVLNNPSIYAADPIIKVGGSGTFKIGENEIEIKNNKDKTLILDSDIQDAYEIRDGAYINRNSDVAFLKGDFPKLGKSEKIVFTDNLKIEVKPRWYRI